MLYELFLNKAVFRFLNLFLATAAPQKNSNKAGLFYFCFCFCCLGLHLQHMEGPRLEVELELHLPACNTATAMQDLNYFCDLHHSSWQRWITERGQGSSLQPHGS